MFCCKSRGDLNETERMAHRNGDRIKPGDEDGDGIQVYLGAYVHSESRSSPFVISSNAVIGVQHGKILFLDVEDNLEILKEKYSLSSDNIHVLGRGEFLMPGLVDTHIHAPQYPNAGLGLNLPLLEWLTKYTFPMESRFEDTVFARSCYKKVVQRTLNCGTTTASYFATIHKSAAEVLADIVELSGQRAFIGKVNMDCYCPSNYIETTQGSLKSTEEFIISMLKRKSPRVKPIITPRFALTCSAELMKGLADLAKKLICVNPSREIERALELFPNSKSYTHIYEEMGLLTDKAIMAHCVHMSEEEISLLKKYSTGVAHCPASNMCLLSGLCPVRRMIEAGVNVGLGTDVSGGYTASILEAMRHTILMSKCLRMKDPEYEPLSYQEVFYLGTLGGAEALSVGDQIGNFQVGKCFDALHIDMASTGSPIHIFPGESLDDMIQKFIMLGDDRNIAQVFVDGRKVKIPVQPLFT